MVVTAKVVAPVLAVATILAMTIPAGFDTTSTVYLALMHLATIPAALLAIPRAAMALPDRLASG